jgi:hypothetical protein
VAFASLAGILRSPAIIWGRSSLAGGGGEVDDDDDDEAFGARPLSETELTLGG